MTSKKELKECAKKCEDCLCWLEHCEAECCKQFKMTKSVLVKRRGGYTTTIVPNIDLKNYLRLHGVNFMVDKKAFIETYKYIQEDKGDEIIFHRPCNALDENNHCTLHATDDKPLICRAFDPLNPGGLGKRVYTTPNCLANYKEVKE